MFHHVTNTYLSKAVKLVWFSGFKVWLLTVVISIATLYAHGKYQTLTILYQIK